MFQKFGELLSKVILLVFLSIGCTTIHYQSNETIPVLWGSQKELTMWLSAIVIGSASSSHLPIVSRGAVAMFGLLMLLSGAY